MTPGELTPEGPAHIFAYGTLLPDHDAWPVLEPWVVDAPRPDAVAGRLYDTGRGYPAATFTGDPEAAGSVVHGMVLTLDPSRSKAALAALDRYEGDDYRRIAVRTEAGQACETYTWIGTLAGCRLVPGGRFGV
ncbi:MAG: hypothetical protein QOG65_1792 [Actinomycetota bacterium]|nr:hypothetical protein [Actinomycetota bacterium]